MQTKEPVMARSRTTLNLDAELIDQARRALGTRTTTETIHAALRQAVDRAELDELIRQDFSLLDEATIADLRTPRSAA
jgi:Arc/MetJ family transcription regulator